MFDLTLWIMFICDLQLFVPFCCALLRLPFHSLRGSTRANARTRRTNERGAPSLLHVARKRGALTSWHSQEHARQACKRLCCPRQANAARSEAFHTDVSFLPNSFLTLTVVSPHWRPHHNNKTRCQRQRHHPAS